jgi:Domain of unknown function (DUF4105)
VLDFCTNFGCQVSRCALAAIVVIVCLGGCRSVEKVVRPSNFRDWEPEQAVLPTVEYQGTQVTVRNVRNCQYFANDVYLVDYYDKTFELNNVRGVDLIVAPFAEMPAFAHTFVSFEITGPDGKPDYLAVSVEVRKEKDERYSTLKGSARQYELMYVLADERDVIQQRTNFRGEEVYLYDTVATPEAARALLSDVLTRVNKLSKEPEFYDTLTNNCTSNIVRHINRIKPNRIVADVRMLLPGYADELAYDEGLLVRQGSFLDTKRAAHINPLAQRYAGREDFSQLIRRR